MDFTERMLERNRSRCPKPETRGVSSQTSLPLKEVHDNTVTTIASTSVDIKKSYSGNNKVTIETTVTMRKLPKMSSSPKNTSCASNNISNEDETTSTEGECDSTDGKENVTSQDTKCPLRQDTKSRLQRLGVLYSDDPSRLSSPIHRTEEQFLIDEDKPIQRNTKSTARSARLAALAETINNWEDDLGHHAMDQEAKGFSRSESNQRIIYDYNNKDKLLSPTKSSPTVSNNTGSPRKNSPIKSTSPVTVTSPAKGRFGSPIHMGTSMIKTNETTVPHSSDDDAPAPTMGVKQLRSPRKPPPSGSVLDRAQRYIESTSPPVKRTRDPAELPLAERMALFERNAGVAVLPKAPFAMPVPAKKLQPVDKENRTLRNQNGLQKVQPLPQTSLQGSTSSLHDRLAVFERGSDNSSKDHMKEILSEREKEIEMLKHRWDRYKGIADPTPQDFQPSAPPMSPPPAPPMPTPPQQFEFDNRRYSGHYSDEDNEELKDQLSPLQVHPKTVYPVLKEVKKVKISPPKPGNIYPCLSDMEVESEEIQESEIEESDDNRSSSSSTSIESDFNSLGRHIVNISQTNLKRDWPVSEHSENEENVINEIDDFLDEALDESSEEPTPPKRRSYSHNAESEASTSFEYSKSREDSVEPNHPLLHTVSFYRKQQNMTLKPSPTKHIQINPMSDSSEDSIERMEEELDRELKQVEQKIEMLQQEVEIQQIIISQSSQALNLCYSTIEFSGSTEQVEAEKLLLLATQRRLAAQHEIQRLRIEQTIRPKAPGNKNLTERGSLMLSHITVPLRMDVTHQAAKDDQCYYLVCLVHSDERVLCTDVMCAPRSLHNHNKLTFPNKIILDGLYSDFKVTVEVYTLTARNKELIPHDVKYHINTTKKDASKLKLTPRKGKDSKLLITSVQSPGGPMAVRSSAFSMAGYVIFSLREIHRTQFTLNKNAYTSVLEGTMQLKIESEMSIDVQYRGFLTMFEDVSGFGAWHRRWCLLKGDVLSYWKYPDDEHTKIPLGTIELSMCTTQEVGVVRRDVCARPNTISLEISRPTKSTDVGSSTIRHLLSADTKEERIQWCQYLNRALALIRAWGVPVPK